MDAADIIYLSLALVMYVAFVHSLLVAQDKDDDRNH